MSEVDQLKARIVELERAVEIKTRKKEHFFILWRGAVEALAYCLKENLELRLIAKALIDPDIPEEARISAVRLLRKILERDASGLPESAD